MILAACGAATSDAEMAAQQQRALAATVAAGSGVNTIIGLAATGEALATPVPSPVAPAATSAPTNPPSPAPATSAPTEAATVAPATAVPATSEPTIGPKLQSTIEPTTPAVTVQPTAIAKSQAPAAATTAAQPSPVPPSPSPVPPSPSPVPPSPVPPSPIPASPIPVSPMPPSGGGTATLSFTDLYSGASITGPILSTKATDLNGRKVVMTGYMAPPLKPDLDFFVLTRDPMVYCPFCSSASDWPFDIVFVRMASGSVPPIVPTQGIRVVGTFQTGTATDAATGFVSQIRIIADSVEVVQ